MTTPFHRVISAGQIVTSEWGNSVWDQSIMRFATAADRDAQFPAPPDGAMCYLNDQAALMTRRNGAWVYQRTTDIQSGSSVITTSSAGGYVINFPRPFVDANIVVVVCNGDNLLQMVAINTAPGAGAVTATLFQGRVYVTAGPAANAGVRINWTAVHL